MKLVIMGSSTGGPRIIFDIFSNLPKIPAAIIIVQHMPLTTTHRLSKRLSQLCMGEIIVPEGGELIKPGNIYLAPGDSHLILRKNEELLLSQDEKVNFVRPSVDVTMLSVKADSRLQVTGIILSGMGSDGAEGMAYLKSLGGTTIVQDPETCTISSMPLAAIRLTDIDNVFTPAEIRSYLLALK